MRMDVEPGLPLPRETAIYAETFIIGVHALRVKLADLL